jgi:hypothetical protein
MLPRMRSDLPASGGVTVTKHNATARRRCFARQRPRRKGGVVPESAVREGGKQNRHKNTISHMTLAEGIVAHGGDIPQVAAPISSPEVRQTDISTQRSFQS